MSNEQASSTAPLWRDEDIANDAKRASSNPTIQAIIRACLLFMRSGYEAERRADKARIAEYERQVAALKQEATKSDERKAERQRWGYKDDEQANALGANRTE